MLKKDCEKSDKQMTLIIGAKCADGIVVIADKKVVEDVDITSKDKIYLLENLGVGFSGAGIGELFDKFLAYTWINIEERKKTKAHELKEKNPKIDEKELVEKINSPYDYANEFVEDCEGILMKIKQKYPDFVVKYGNPLSVLITFRAGMNAELHTLNIKNCIDSKRMTFVALGSGSPYAQVFLKELWSEEITMEEMAKVGCFIVNYIEKKKLDNFVGEGIQVLFMPDFDERYFELAKKSDRTEQENLELQKKYGITTKHKNKDVFLNVSNALGEFEKDIKNLKDIIKKN